MLRIYTRLLPKRIVLVTLHGRLVLGDETRCFRIAMDRLINTRYQLIAIDCGGVEKIDCAGLGELVRSHTEGERSNVEIALFNVNQYLLDLLVTTKLLAVFPLLGDQTPAPCRLERRPTDMGSGVANAPNAHAS